MTIQWVCTSVKLNSVCLIEYIMRELLALIKLLLL